MTLKKRLDRLEGGGKNDLVVFLTSYETESGEAQTRRAVIIKRPGHYRQLIRKTSESEAEFRARIEAMKVA